MAKALCKICNNSFHWLGEHLLEAHDLTIEDYLAKFPGAPLESSRLQNKVGNYKRKKPCLENINISMGSFSFPVNFDVPAEACLPEPPFYTFPKTGKAAGQIKRCLRHLAAKRKLYLWGSPGTGKDALFHAYCAKTRTPSHTYEINPNKDIEAWFFEKNLNAEGTEWTEGLLLKQLRDGYLTSSGRRIPYLILFTDFDRASKSQAEALRLITDSIEGRITGPNGQTYKVFPGTQICCTANTMGSGDEMGRCISANPIDTSILNRFERKVHLQFMEWSDELGILKKKFPSVVSFLEEVKQIESLKEITIAWRTAIEKQQLFGEFSHRDLCYIVSDIEDIRKLSPNIKNPLKEAVNCYIDGLPDEHSRAEAIKLCNPHIKGGVVRSKKSKGNIP